MRCQLFAALSLCCTAARAEEIDYKKLYAKVGPGVVLIYGERGETGSVGAGSIIREDGLVVSNAHVISPQEAVKWHAQKAFDDLEREAQRYKK